MLCTCVGRFPRGWHKALDPHRSERCRKGVSKNGKSGKHDLEGMVCHSDSLWRCRHHSISNTLNDFDLTCICSQTSWPAIISTRQKGFTRLWRVELLLPKRPSSLNRFQAMPEDGQNRPLHSHLSEKGGVRNDPAFLPHVSAYYV